MEAMSCRISILGSFDRKLQAIRRKPTALISCLLMGLGAALCYGTVKAGEPAPKDEAYVLDHVENSGIERYYNGTLTLDGYYVMDVSGEGVSFIPKPKFVHAIPEMEELGETIFFQDASIAAQMMHLEKLSKQIDASRYCLGGGKARITLRSITVGDGPARKWYAAAIDRVYSHSEPRSYLCSDQANMDKFYACVDPLPGHKPVCKGVFTP
jgi:hypothetical protein